MTLVTRYLSGDRSAGDALLREYDWLVRATAGKATRRHPQHRDEMQQVCRIALLASLKTWDAEKGALTTHAVWEMRGQMREAWLLLRTVRLPSWLDESLRKAKRDGVDANPRAMVEAGVTPPRYNPPETVLLGRGHADMTRARTTVPSPEEQYIQAERVADALAVAEQVLTDREQIVIARRLDGETLEQIGGFLGCERERVRQIERRALAKMRARVSARRTEAERRAA